MRTSKTLRILALTLALAGCPKPPDSIPDAGGGPESPDAGLVEVPPTPRIFEITVVAETVDAGLVAIPFAEGARPLIPPATALTLQANQPIKNYRVRTFDEADRAMVSDDVPEESDAGVTYRIAFPAPLKTGHKYTLVVDAQTGAAFTDDRGEPLGDQRLEFQIAGEKEKPPPPSKKPAKKKRR